MTDDTHVFDSHVTLWSSSLAIAIGCVAFLLAVRAVGSENGRDGLAALFVALFGLAIGLGVYPFMFGLAPFGALGLAHAARLLVAHARSAR